MSLKEQVKQNIQLGYIMLGLSIAIPLVAIAVVEFLGPLGVSRRFTGGLNYIYELAASIVLLIDLYYVFFSYPQKKRNSRPQSNEDRILEYRSNVITKIGLLDGSIMFTSLAYLLNGQNWVCMLYLPALLGIIIIMPTKTKIMRQTNIAEQELN